LPADIPGSTGARQHLKQRFGELFELKCDLLLYDVTSTSFEGDVENCAIAKRGYSRDSRGDRPQVCIGLVVTEEGFPLGYEVFAGNMHDSLTVKSIVKSLERKHGALNRVWVMDRGMVSNDNLEFLRERGAKYIVGTPKAMLRQFERHLTEQNWVVAQEGVDVKLVPSPDGEETFLLARSVDRRSKELAMHEKFIGHMEAGLFKLRAAAESGRLRDETLAGERLGRLKERFWRASQAFDARSGSCRSRSADSIWKGAGSATRSSTNGHNWSMAATSCGRISPALIRPRSGSDTSSSPRRSGPSGSRRMNWRFGPCGIRRKTACGPTCASASWRMPCGRRWPAG
jgi:hypothetical protein